jgi:hypothetical protein
MDMTLVHALLVAGPCAFGLAAAVTMDRIFGVLNPKGRIKDIGIVLGWFFGNGALVTVSITSAKLAINLGIPIADGIALLSYFLGFGLAVSAIATAKWFLTWLARRRENPLIRILGEHLGRREIDLLLLVLNGGKEVGEAGSELEIPLEIAPKVYSEALKKLQKIGVELFKELAEQQRINDTK